MRGQDRRANRALVGAAHAFNVVAVNPFPQRRDCRLACGKAGHRGAGIIGAQSRDPAFAVRVDIDEVRIGQHCLIALDHKRAEWDGDTANPFPTFERRNVAAGANLGTRLLYMCGKYAPSHCLSWISHADRDQSIAGGSHPNVIAIIVENSGRMQPLYSAIVPPRKTPVVLAAAQLSDYYCRAFTEPRLRSRVEFGLLFLIVTREQRPHGARDAAKFLNIMCFKCIIQLVEENPKVAMALAQRSGQRGLSAAFNGGKEFLLFDGHMLLNAPAELGKRSHGGVPLRCTDIRPRRIKGLLQSAVIAGKDLANVFHLEKLAPFGGQNTSPRPIAATIALEMIGPMPGTVINRWQAGSCWTSVSMSADRPSMRSSSRRQSPARASITCTMRGDRTSVRVARICGSPARRKRSPWRTATPRSNRKARI